MRLDEVGLEAHFAATLHMPLRLAVAADPVAELELTRGEQVQLARFEVEERRAEWLRGRRALKRLQARLGRDTDTSMLAFPHPQVSLTHTAGLAIAVGLARAGAGLGVDLELQRAPRPGSERFFLDAREQAWLDAASAASRPRAMLRLWTVKEALYKANLANHGTLLAHYQALDCSRSAGRARCGDEPVSYRYASVPLGRGFLSVARRWASC